MIAGGKCHTTPTYSTSHQLTKGFGKGECVRQKKQEKLRLGHGKKYLTEIESGFLLTEMRLLTNLIGNRKKGFPSLSTILVFIYSPIGILQEQKTKKSQGIPQKYSKVTPFGQGIKLMEQKRATRHKNPVYLGKSIVSLAKTHGFSSIL